MFFLVAIFILLLRAHVSKGLDLHQQTWKYCPFLVNNGKHRYVARVTYDGTNYHGFQEQPSKFLTVQGTISERLSRRFNSRVKPTGASRTDFGVHARGQVIHFDLEPGQLTDFSHLEFHINRMLPDDIKLYNISYAPFGTPEQEATSDIFHATKSAVGKLYMYRFCTNKFVDPQLRHRYAHFYRPLNIDTLQRCLQEFVGTHDFSAYGNRMEQLAKTYAENNWHKELTPIRTIHRADLIDEGGGYYRIEFHITSALYRMIRNIVGTSAYVAMGLMTEDTLKSLLHDGKSRQDNLAKSAVANGLCLEHVYYTNY